MISRRSLLLGGAALLMPRKVVARSDASVILAGDSLAYQLGPVLRSVAKAHGAAIGVAGRGGSSARQWIRKQWLERALIEHPRADTVLFSLGVNCTHSERSKLRGDIEHLLSIARAAPNSPTPYWLIPPPLGVDTRYLRDAVLATGVATVYAPEDAPLEVDGIHLKVRGYYMWSKRIAEVLWGP